MATIVSNPRRPRASRVARGVVLALLLVSPLAADGPDDGIALTVVRSPVPGQLSLSWSGGEAPYLIYRATDPAAVVTPGTRVATTGAVGLDLPEGAAPIDYFLAVGVDRSSAVLATSDCLTAGTTARAAIVLDLRDSLGHPLAGASVTMQTDLGTLGAVQPDGNLYRAVLSPPAVPGGPATVSVTAEGVPLSSTASVAFAAPLDAPAGGAGGCPADGNLRVRVVDPAGQPISGARVLVGSTEAASVFETTPGAGPSAGNTGSTDAQGYLEFVDFGTNLDGPQTVTAAVADRRYVSFVDMDAADVVLPLALVDSTAPGAVYTGDVTNVPAPANDPIELAVMLPDVSIESVLSFSVADLLADSGCYNAGGLAGSVAVPGNVYIPAQCAAQFIVCLQQLPEHVYTSAPLAFGERRLLALRGNAPLSALTAGDFSQALGSFTLNGIGAASVTAASPGPTTLDLPIGQALTANLSCTIDHAPLNSDVFCVSAGDWDSASDPDLTPGSGRLLLTGFRPGDATGATGPFGITGVTTVSRTGPFAGIEYLGAAVAQYSDPLAPDVPAGTGNGTSAILDRSGSPYDATGGVMTFDDFFPIRTLSRTGRTFSIGALPGVGHPSPDLTRITLDQVVTETYTACLADDSTRTRRLPLWEIYLPGAATEWTLPTPPPGWPREAVGGDLAGLVDPAVTPENDTLEQSATTFHLGTAPGFTYPQLRLAELRLHLTHVVANSAAY